MSSRKRFLYSFALMTAIIAFGLAMLLSFVTHA